MDKHVVIIALLLQSCDLLLLLSVEFFSWSLVHKVLF